MFFFFSTTQSQERGCCRHGGCCRHSNQPTISFYTSSFFQTNARTCAFFPHTIWNFIWFPRRSSCCFSALVDFINELYLLYACIWNAKITEVAKTTTTTTKKCLWKFYCEFVKWVKYKIASVCQWVLRVNTEHRY